MAIEEAVEQKAQDAAVKAVETGGQLTLRASKALALMLVKNGWKLTTGTAVRISGTVKHHMDTGKVSEKKLQSLGQDVHMIELPEDSLKAVSKSLREAGITYHVEQTDDDGYYLHFQGKDKDHVEHAVKRAFERIGLTFDAEEITPQQRTGQQQNPSDPNADEARKSAEPTDPAEQPHARAEEPQPAEAPKPEPRQSEPAAELQRTEAERRTSNPTGRASRKGKKTRADFLAELKQRTAEKVTESRQTPKRTRRQSRKHNTR